MDVYQELTVIPNTRVAPRRRARESAPNLRTGNARLFDQLTASSVLRAATELMSRVNPLVMRLMPRIAPIAQIELPGQGRQIRYARNRVTTPSNRTHPEPGNGRNWKNVTVSSTPSMKNITAIARVRDSSASPGLKAR